MRTRSTWRGLVNMACTRWRERGRSSADAASRLPRPPCSKTWTFGRTDAVEDYVGQLRKVRGRMMRALFRGGAGWLGARFLRLRGRRLHGAHPRLPQEGVPLASVSGISADLAVGDLARASLTRIGVEPNARVQGTVPVTRQPVPAAPRPRAGFVVVVRPPSAVTLRLGRDLRAGS
jgi:hypothetical protein